ncbi:MAG: YdcF family protein [Anaerolineae bacterium]|nr:YdcF family protein [Anaerolineae bacterium]
MKRWPRILLIILGIGLGAGIFLCLWPWLVSKYYHRLIYAPDDVPPERVAIVFGARIYKDGRLSAMLLDRVETAVQLYEAGKVDKLLLSGDNRFADYDEPGRMMDYALSRGVPAENIQPDYAGRRTYDTCYRAKAIFRLDSAVLVTQNFHLPRALFTCRNLGVEAVGVNADLRTYHPLSVRWSKTREFLATVNALFDVIRQKPAPVLGEPIPLN